MTSEVAHLDLDLNPDLIARNPEFAAEQLKLALAHIEQVLQLADRQQVLALCSQDSDLPAFQQRLLMELFRGGGGETVFGSRDELTGLLSRSSLLDRFASPHPDGAARSDSLAICFIDLDGFKAINDQHGHAIGDQVLVAISKRIQAAIRPADLAVRWGGDEFIVVFEGVQNPDLIMQLASRLLGIIAEPLQLNLDSPMRLFLGASIGVAIRADEKLSVRDLIDRADRAMYQAKKSGQNSIHIFS